MLSLIISLSLLLVAKSTDLWVFTPETISEYGFADPPFAGDEYGQGLICDASNMPLTILSGHDLPTRAFTITAGVSIDEPQRWGGIVGCVQDDADEERGWILGYNESQFTIGLSTVGADDGNGMMTYLNSGELKYELGKWYYIVATYDGKTLQLYVNGKLANETTEQSGDILYNNESPFVIGGYVDANENHPFDGRLLGVGITSAVTSTQTIENRYKSQASLSLLPAWTNTILGWEVEPFLTWPTIEAMSVTFETTVPTTATIRCVQDNGTGEITMESDETTLHHFRLSKLKTNQKYFYTVQATDANGETITSEQLSFRTAPGINDSYTFVAIGDTQSQADVVKRVADLAYMHRPNLVVHAGDLVSTGTVKADWTGHFFPSMQPLISRVPLMPVLGNHEQDAQHYYDYMDLPQPEMYYSFVFGNAEFFMIDGNRELGDDTPQLLWLENALSKSTSVWKFAVLHQPPYTSDADDYGDTYKTTSTRGDTNVQHIIELLEKHGVDICFSGHVHDYERTFPILDEHVVPAKQGGVMYITTAGGGGYLEHFDPTNTWFGHKKANYHHLVYLAIHGKILEFQAIDEYGQLFDVMTIDKTSLKDTIE